MLKHIYIKNFTIIDELDLELFNGMMVLTGETGAGKSIVIDAIELALGRRASVDMVHEGAERADICVTFDIARNMEAIQFLKEYDLDNEEICLLRRVIHKDGRSKSSVNGVPVTQSVLRELSELLVNIHGQHEFQTLLKREHQRGLLDDFAHHDDLLKDIKKIYVDWRETKKEIERLDQGG